jgi:isochorismate pyruvate lyase
MLPPEECQTMEDVRAGIDALDRELVALLATRQRFIEAAARIKTDRNRVRDTARIEDVVAKVKTQARHSGLSEDIAEQVWRSLIEASITHELRQWDELRGARSDCSASS